jgi:hypothetical protein
MKPSSIVLRSGDREWKDYACLVINCTVTANTDEIIAE